MKKSDHCKNPSWRMEKLDEVVKNEILKVEFKEIKRKEKKDPTENQLKELDKQMGKLIDLYQVDGIDIGKLSERINALKAKKAAILSAKKPDNRLPIDEAMTLKDKARKVFESGELSEQKAIVDALINKIIVEEDGITIHWAFE